MFKFDNKSRCTLLIVCVMIASSLIAMQPRVAATQTAGFQSFADPSPSLPSTANVTVVALNGTQYFLNSTQLAALSSTTGPGGMSKGNLPYGINNYTGVSLNALANLIGGLNRSVVLSVVAYDGYIKNFTYTQVVNGNFSGSTYNPITGNPASPTKPIVPILAYYNNSELIPPSPGSGPLTTAIVGNDSLATPGKYWVKWVDKIEILPTPVPEFPVVVLIPLFIALTLVAAAATVWLGRKSLRSHSSTKRDE